MHDKRAVKDERGTHIAEFHTLDHRDLNAVYALAHPLKEMWIAPFC